MDHRKNLRIFNLKLKIMKNIHILPTDKPSRVYLNGFQVLSLDDKIEIVTDEYSKNQNIYITSDEEIKEGDWIFDLDINRIVKADNLKVITSKKSQCWYYKKIILTTDQDLIKDGVQAIDDEFLEWFVKNPKCIWKYKIIISKEEVKQNKIFVPANTFKVGEEFKINGILQKTIDTTVDNYFVVKPKQQCKDCNDSLTDCTCIEDTIDMKQETLEDKLESLVVQWHQRQLRYEEVADDNIASEHNNRKFTYKAMATRDCWKELLTLLNESKK